jgi:hypothetical protein
MDSADIGGACERGVSGVKGLAEKNGECGRIGESEYDDECE